MFKFMKRVLCTNHRYRKKDIWGYSKRSGGDNLVISCTRYVCQKCNNEVIVEDVEVEKDYYTKWEIGNK